MNNAALAVVEPSAVAPPSQRLSFSRDDIELMKDTICKGATDSELALFIQDAQRRGLDPFARQICAVFRWDGRQRREVMTIQVTIDGFRLIAERTAKYGGQLGPYWCGPDGKWVEVWLSDEFPAAAKVGVIRRDWEQPLWSVATWKAYAQKTKDGAITRMWAQMPDLMLAKAAESLALRRAFPAELSGVYTPEEMAQAGPIIEATGGVRSAAPRPMRPVDGGEVDETTGEYRPVPDDAPAPSGEPTAGRKEPTPMQRLHGHAKGRKLTPDDVHALAVYWYGVASRTDLDERQIAGFIAALDEKSGQALDDEQLADALAKAYELASDTQEPAPVADEPVLSFTAFWEWVKGEGLPHPGDKLVKWLGEDIKHLTPQQAKELVEARRRDLAELERAGK